MRVFVLSKKKICIGSLILFIIFMIIFVEVGLTCNNIIHNDFDSKIRGLCNGEEKIAYLTFDDGPNPTVTPKVLDILKAEDIKATFFVIGKLTEAHPELVKRAYEEGHYIANHGYR